MAKPADKKINLKTLILILEFLVLGLIVYLIAAPFYPGIKYNLARYLNQAEPKETQGPAISQTIEAVEKQATSTGQNLSANRVKIAKIGVDIPRSEEHTSELQSP
jgi:hypothetical protein